MASTVMLLNVASFRCSSKSHQMELSAWPGVRSREPGFDVIGDGGFNQFSGEDGILGVVELTEIFLGEETFGERVALFFEEFGGNARAFRGGGGDAFPTFAAVG